MNKGELVNSIASATGQTKADVERFLNAFQDVLTGTLKKGTKFSWVGFFSMEPTQRKETTGRNPRTGEEIKIPAKTVVKMKAGKMLADAVN